MSGAKLLDFNLANLQNLEFQNLEMRLEQRLNAIKNFPDLEQLIKTMNPLLKAKRFSLEEQRSLMRLRQRAYDRKRNPKFQTLLSLEVAKPVVKQMTFLDAAGSKKIPQIKPIFSKKPTIQTGASMSMVVTEKPLVVKTSNHNFSQGVLKAINGIDGEQVVKTAPKLLFWLLAAVLVSYLLWKQSLDLYQSASVYMLTDMKP